VTKVGLATVQRDGIDFEFDVFGSMDTMNNMTIEKSRCPSLTGQMYARPGEELAKELLGWLETGEPVEPVKFEQPEPEPEPKANGKPSPSLNEVIRNKLSELFVGKEIVVQKFMVMRGQIKDGETWQAITPSYADSILDKPDVFISTAMSHIK
jgi:hypothetical protein